MRTARVNGVSLHYLDRGKGEPIVFVHGGLGDYGELGDVASALLPRYRVITYSRRYDSPNANPLRPGYSARVDAEDLAGLIRELRLGPVHLVGASYGAYTSLLVALDHPELVRSLTLAEPPLVGWLQRDPAGRAALSDFDRRFWKPMRTAALAGDDERLLRVTVAFFSGEGEARRMPPELHDILLRNVAEFHALAKSSDPFPPIAAARVARLRMPVLFMTGERTYAGAKAIDGQLTRTLPTARRVVVPGADHNMCTEKAAACAAAIATFLGRQ